MPLTPAGLARRSRLRSQGPVLADPCPCCAADLARPGGHTRRVALTTGTRGVFAWQCPHCRGCWHETSAGTPELLTP